MIRLLLEDQGSVQVITVCYPFCIFRRLYLMAEPLSLSLCTAMLSVSKYQVYLRYLHWWSLTVLVHCFVETLFPCYNFQEDQFLLVSLLRDHRGPAPLPCNHNQENELRTKKSIFHLFFLLLRYKSPHVESNKKMCIHGRLRSASAYN